MAGKLKLPAGWKYTPSKPAKTCEHCGHHEPAAPGRLFRHLGNREWPLVGNSGAAQEREMVRAIIAANESDQEGSG